MMMMNPFIAHVRTMRHALTNITTANCIACILLSHLADVKLFKSKKTRALYSNSTTRRPHTTQLTTLLHRSRLGAV
jgi:hypothetical protein